MGNHDSKIENPNSNVINEITVNLKYPIVYLIIIIAVLVLQFLTTLYQLDKRSLRKNYERAVSMAINIDKV